MKKSLEKYLPYLGGAGVLLYFIFYSKSTNAKTASTFEQEANTKGAPAPSFKQANYLALADKLESAMFDLGTDEDSILRVFKVLKNDTDFALLFKAFGKRPKFEFGVNQGNWNLIQWLQSELNDSEQAEVNQILSSKGITYKI